MFNFYSKWIFFLFEQGTKTAEQIFHFLVTAALILPELTIVEVVERLQLPEPQFQPTQLLVRLSRRQGWQSTELEWRRYVDLIQLLDQCMVVVLMVEQQEDAKKKEIVKHKEICQWKSL